jgi:hypothetical protein
MSPSPSPGFEVSISVATRERIRQLHDLAAADGRRDQFLSALRSITERLKRDPMSFGEELFDLRGLRLTIKVGVVLPIAVEFGIYEERRQVFVRDFRYVSPG